MAADTRTAFIVTRPGGEPYDSSGVPLATNIRAAWKAPRWRRSWEKPSKEFPPVAYASLPLAAYFGASPRDVPGAVYECEVEVAGPGPRADSDIWFDPGLLVKSLYAVRRHDFPTPSTRQRILFALNCLGPLGKDASLALLASAYRKGEGGDPDWAKDIQLRLIDTSAAIGIRDRVTRFPALASVAGAIRWADLQPDLAEHCAADAVRQIGHYASHFKAFWFDLEAFAAAAFADGQKSAGPAGES